MGDGGLRGGAVSFSRSGQQYLRIGRQTLDDTPPLPERAGRTPLDDNGAAHTFSLWCKPTTLPEHGSAERHFLLETALGGSTAAGYVLSAGFRASATDASKVNLELHTVTLQPAGAASTAQPTPLAHGPFACELDRTIFTDRWAHVAMTFDSTRLRLYVDGGEVAAHLLSVPGPAAETAGLILGGHREGTGRNFDGMIDEVALWSRALTAVEITALHNSGTPNALPTEIGAVDTDGDTLEDWWENLNGLDPEDGDDALVDVDGDFVPAWLERTVGTHPQTDDSALYDYIREMISPGALSVPMAFRNPAEGTLSVRLFAEESVGLENWSGVGPGAALAGDVLSGDFLFSLPVAPPAPWFIRFEIEP
jgi:hypothetical protein